MKKTLVWGMIFGANVAGAAFLWSAFGSSYATAGLSISDLTYGAIDIDGDGQYTRGDDKVVEYLVEQAPQHLREALKSAVVNPDGGVDISSYFATLTLVEARGNPE